ncbi:hypothetical protein DFA_05857 [Cavenderia fasciculata]|uniref:Uncharacterized protein n=1 Tax=Cavenderia fasciculata TaxID=261658 RepID=F4PN33_CACFS|nr:uncharacterized protein DFA_05857 [Cavenderia fasciculata]EGG23723.1 hypothetical protein DFA_05857 [Cavenderia fasciculata]|eukprot:XP_004361574.1 hypothetical protein DFA_05857 [Cavenderia fasciculata]
MKLEESNQQQQQQHQHQPQTVINNYYNTYNYYSGPPPPSSSCQLQSPPIPLLKSSDINILVHLEKIADVNGVGGEFVGTRGQCRRLEGFRLQWNKPVEGLSFTYMAHLQNIGDVSWVNEGQFIGTRGECRRLEGFAIKLTGSLASQYKIQYSAHLEGHGDTSTYSNGEYCGTRGQSRRVEENSSGGSSSSSSRYSTFVLFNGYYFLIPYHEH